MRDCISNSASRFRKHVGCPLSCRSGGTQSTARQFRALSLRFVDCRLSGAVRLRTALVSFSGYLHGAVHFASFLFQSFIQKIYLLLYPDRRHCKVKVLLTGCKMLLPEDRNFAHHIYFTAIRQGRVWICNVAFWMHIVFVKRRIIIQMPKYGIPSIISSFDYH